MNTAIYARVSTSDQNCEVQLRELREYVSRRGWTVSKEYVDTGFSGSKASRPAWDQLMKDCSGRLVDCVLTYKLDRAGRSVLNLSQALAALDSHGVRFIAVTQGLDTDASNPTSRLLLNVLASVAEFERELIKERTLAGIRAAKAKGKKLGRPLKVFRRDQVIQLRDEEGLSWRLIGERLGVPAMTAFNSYHHNRTKKAPQSESATTGKMVVSEAIA